MNIYLLRHGEAEEQHPVKFPDDASRPLTKDGARKLEDYFERLRPFMKKPDIILASPLLRAAQTAEIFLKATKLKGEIEMHAELLPEASPEEILPWFRGIDTAVVVGHLPHLPQFAALLLGITNPVFDLKKGGLALIESNSPAGRGTGVLRWLVSPKLFLAD